MVLKDDGDLVRDAIAIKRDIERKRDEGCRLEASINLLSIAAMSGLP